ncbi:MAG TPA: beta-ketoacyl synthase chain length factor [Rhodopila sp.]|nr:beta-ketoacyl synthase chain length factor [Rhodopila sp.]
MTGLSFHVKAWAAWAPGRETAAAWLQWAGQPAQSSDTDHKPVPVLLRRRVSPLGQQALKAAWSLPDSATGRLIACSRHGEFGRTLSILDSLAVRTGTSPADFTLSVHNALLGLLSIARGNRQGHTMIAAGTESFGFGLLEAVSCLADSPTYPVVLVYFDEPLPPPYDVFDQPALDQSAPDPIAIALTLSATEGAPVILTTTQAESPPDPTGALTFMRVLLGAAPHATTTGEHFTWHWRSGHAPD